MLNKRDKTQKALQALTKLTPGKYPQLLKLRNEPRGGKGAVFWAPSGAFCGPSS